MNKILTIIFLLIVLIFVQGCKSSKVEVGKTKIIYEPVMTASKEIN